MKRLGSIMVAALMLVSVAGCGSTVNKNSDKEIKIGGTSISNVTYEAIKPIYEKMGYKTTFVMFDSNPVVLEACNSKEIDMAIGQHKKFVESFDANKKADLEMVKPYGYYTGIGLYSNKYKTPSEIPDGSQIAVMNDAMNMGIALRILNDAGLISLKEGTLNPTIGDIAENPKNLKIIDMDQAQTVTALSDMAAATIFFTHMSNAKLDPTSYIARDKDMINYPMGPIVKKENINAQWAVDFAKCYKEKEVQNNINEKFPGVFQFYESDDQVKE